jgi:hypothetical protein
MTLSLRSIMRLMHMKAPGISISRDAALLLKIELERRAENITVQASRIHHRENEMRQEIGERIKKRLSPKNVKMAIDGKFAGEGANGEH